MHVYSCYLYVIAPLHWGYNTARWTSPTGPYPPDAQGIRDENTSAFRSVKYIVSGPLDGVHRRGHIEHRPRLAESGLSNTDYPYIGTGCTSRRALRIMRLELHEM